MLRVAASAAGLILQLFFVLAKEEGFASAM
jgi:hypothetical protein